MDSFLTQLLATFVVEETDPLDSRFIICTPNYKNIRNHLADLGTAIIDKVKAGDGINTVHLGVSGGGKSSLIGAFQTRELQTCLPHKEGDSALGQNRAWTTRLGRSLDTQGLNDTHTASQNFGLVNNREQIAQNLRQMQSFGLHKVHTIFAHLTENRTTDAMLKTFEQAIRFADYQAQNIIIVTWRGRTPSRVAKQGLLRAVSSTDLPRPVHLGTVRTIDLNLLGIDDDELLEDRSSQGRYQAPASPAPGSTESQLHYFHEREAIQLFMLGVMRHLLDNPITLVRRDQFCSKWCQNSGDARCFSPKCHPRLIPSHPLNSDVSASSLAMSHNGELKEKRKHIHISNGNEGVFKSGIIRAVSGKVWKNNGTPQASKAAGKVVAKDMGGMVGVKVASDLSEKAAAGLKPLQGLSAKQAAEVFQKAGLELIDDGDRLIDLTQLGDVVMELPEGVTLDQAAAEEGVRFLLRDPNMVEKVSSKGVSALGAATKILQYVPYVQVGAAALSISGLGSWTCCGGAMNGIIGKSEGCARQWSCCKQWQTVGGDEVPCTRDVCGSCHGDSNVPPANNSGELKCVGCNSYVGKIVRDGMVQILQVRGCADVDPARGIDHSVVAR